MADPAEHMRRFQELNSQFLEALTSRSQTICESQLHFQQTVTEQWGQTLAAEKERLQVSTGSEAVKSMMALCLSANAFQREQLELLLDTQIEWNDMVRSFLDDAIAQQATAPTPSDDASAPSDGPSQ